MTRAKSKSAGRARAAQAGKAVEAQTGEMAHKIWLAGVGAYGKAYDAALAGASALNTQSADVFEDLVKRGTEIEDDMRARLAADERLSKAGERVAKVVDTARDMQAQARNQFEARMERMRDLLGVDRIGAVSEKIARRVDKLEDEVAGVAAKARSRVADVDLKARLARLTAEIEAVASEAGADVAKTARKAATKTRKAVKAAVAPATADDLSQITGIGPAMTKKLAAAGVTRFAQIAAMKKAELEALDTLIGARGRVLRDNWAKQAKVLAK